jgi:hypothetical protein
MLLVYLKGHCITGKENTKSQIKVSTHSLHKNELQKEEENENGTIEYVNI